MKMKRRKFINDSAKHIAVTLVGASLLNNDLLASNLNLPNQSTSTINNSIFMDIIPTYQNVTTTVKLKGKEVKVHALCTGTVAVKTNFITKNGIGELAKVNILLGKHYTTYLPIWVWVIEHPEGLIVIDTGEISAIMDLDKYLAKESAFMRYFFNHGAKFGVSEKDELNFQFEKVKLKLNDVRLVILTHLHLDHTDGLKFFPKQEIIIGDYECKHPNGNMPTTYPSWFNPNKVNYKKDRVDIFNEAFPLTSAEDLLYVPTPGHTPGHSSVIFKTDDFDILFAGDSSYNQDQVLNYELAGINADYLKSRETYKKLMVYAAEHKTIYLPTHDASSAVRLRDRSFLKNI
jgi:N-acyl homoserine lactone hydrolase